MINVSAGGYYDFYIGRKPRQPYHWGNPFVIQEGFTRDDVCDMFDLWLDGLAYTDTDQERRIWMVAMIPRLGGKVLGCH